MDTLIVTRWDNTALSNFHWLGRTKPAYQESEEVARVGSVIREEAANVTSQAVKTTKPSLLLCISACQGTWAEFAGIRPSLHVFVTNKRLPAPVSYTHLTLPTIYSV